MKKIISIIVFVFLLIKSAFAGYGDCSFGDCKYTPNNGVTYTVCASNSNNPTRCNYTTDGISDNVEINAALLAASVYSGTVKLSEGQFNISSSILIPSNTTLDAGNATIFLSNSSNTNMVKNYNHPSADSNITLIGGIWNGNGGNQNSPTITLTAGNFAIWMKNVTNLLIRDVYVLEPGGWSMNIQRCTDVRASNLRFYNTGAHLNQDGIHILDSNRVVVNGVTGQTNDDIVAVDAEELDTEAITISNVTGVGSHASLKLVNNYFAAGQTVYVQDVVYNNIALYPSSGIGMVKTDNQAGSSGRIRRITINGLTGRTTTLSNNGIFQIGSVGLVDFNVNGFNILDDGNGYITNGGTIGNGNFSNGVIRGVKNGFILASGATPVSFNNLVLISTKPALASTSYGIGVATGASNGTTRISNVHIEGFGTAINCEGETSVTNAHLRGNRLGISHTNTTYSMGLNNVTYDTNDIDSTLTGRVTGLLRSTFVDRKSLTNNSAINIISAVIANNTVIAGNIRYAIEVTDGTDMQVEEGIISYHATNKAGAIANNTVVKSSNQQAMTAGTLTATFAISAANPALISVNANSSLTPSAGYPRISYVVDNLTSQNVNIQ